MTYSTDLAMSFSTFPSGPEVLKPVMLRRSRTTVAADDDRSDSTALARSGQAERTFQAPNANAAVYRGVRADSTPLQIWEGTIIKVDQAAGLMQVTLDAKIGQIPRHTAEIELDSVSPQDHDLVRPGAVFYLTLYKRTIPSVENIEELRFRRRPSWSQAQLARIDADSAMIRSKMRALPTAQ